MNGLGDAGINVRSISDGIDPAVVGEKLSIVAQARSTGKTAVEAAQLVRWISQLRHLTPVTSVSSYL
jgi:hypothetical protein